MAVSSSREGAIVAVVLSIAALGCSSGLGEGEVTGTVSAESCGISPTDPFDLHPDFFVAEMFEDSLNIRIQKGGDAFDYSNVLFVSVLDATAVAESMLGTPLAVGDSVDSPVRMSLSLNETCDFHDRVSIPVSFQAVSGTITFAAIYAPDVSDSTVIEAVFDGVHLVDPSSPTDRYADLSGHFRFLYTRGRPAQVFP